MAKGHEATFMSPIPRMVRLSQAESCPFSWLFISFTDAEVAEDHVEHIFDIDGSGNAAEAAQG